jgi:hypothetical protein
MILSRRFQWTLVITLALTATASRLLFNGLILDFDYGIYQPDGSHYAYRTLIFLGVEPNVAAERIVQWYQIHGIKHNIFSASLLSPENKETWGLVAPRVIYSLLSIPFVYLFGIIGMMVVPILSFLLLIFSVFRVSEILNKQITGLFLVLVLSTSPTVLRWMIANITDSLLAGLFGIVILLLSRETTSKFWSAWIIGLIFLTSFTRFCLPIWVAIALVHWINRRRWDAIIILISSLIAFIPTYFYMPRTAILPGETQSDGIAKILLVIESFFKVGFIEIAQLAALDRILLLTLMIALIVSVKFPREFSSQIFLSVLISVWLIGAINGSLGVNFRYQLPILGFACWVIISNSNKFFNWASRGRVNIVGEETKNQLNSY